MLGPGESLKLRARSGRAGGPSSLSGEKVGASGSSGVEAISREDVGRRGRRESIDKDVGGRG